MFVSCYIFTVSTHTGFKWSLRLRPRLTLLASYRRMFDDVLGLITVCSGYPLDVQFVDDDPCRPNKFYDMS